MRWTGWLSYVYCFTSVIPVPLYEELLTVRLTRILLHSFAVPPVTFSGAQQDAAFGYQCAILFQRKKWIWLQSKGKTSMTIPFLLKGKDVTLEQILLLTILVWSCKKVIQPGASDEEKHIKNLYSSQKKASQIVSKSSPTAKGSTVAQCFHSEWVGWPVWMPSLIRVNQMLS